jgi:hypothetical protein
VKPRQQHSWNAAEQEFHGWGPLYTNEYEDLPPGATDWGKASEGGQCLTAWGQAVLSYRRQRCRHRSASWHASIGYWALQACTILMVAATSISPVLGAQTTYARYLPGALATLLTAFNALVDWRGLARARQRAVRSMDREFSRFNGQRHAYKNLAPGVDITRFCDEIEKINDEAEKVTLLDSRIARDEERGTQEPASSPPTSLP